MGKDELTYEMSRYDRTGVLLDVLNTADPVAYMIKYIRLSEPFHRIETLNRKLVDSYTPMRQDHTAYQNAVPRDQILSTVNLLKVVCTSHDIPTI